jgi:hypothetical protein
VVFAVFIVSRFELYERERRAPPSRELRSNNFYVLGEWLSASGHPVRFSPRWDGVRDISPQEGGLFIQASLFDWGREDILSWVQDGGVMVVSIDFPWYWGNGDAAEAPPAVLALEKFLGDLGIRIYRPPQDEVQDTDDGEEHTVDTGDTNDNIGGSENIDSSDSIDSIDSVSADEDLAADDGASVNETGDSIANLDEGPAFPSYGYNVIFEDPGFEDTDAAGKPFLALRDSEGHIRLIRMALGKGLIAVTGSCFFMYNYSLEDEANARLAWELTGGSLGPGRPALLFVRGRGGSGGLWGLLGERGNLLPPVLSALVLIFIGFWMVLPGFGVPPREESRRRLSITGRFSSEARFLRRYDALEAYVEVYLRELRRLAKGRALGPEVEEVEKALAAGKKIGPVKTAVYLKNLMSALERI